MFIYIQTIDTNQLIQTTFLLKFHFYHKHNYYKNYLNIYENGAGFRY